MHFHFGFTTVEVLWTLTFASLLVLLVVLQGRDRVRCFPWFTTSIALEALHLILSRLLYGRLPRLAYGAILIVLTVISALVGLFVLLEVARRTFHRAPRRLWYTWAAVLVALGAGVLAAWGPWPTWQSIHLDSALTGLVLMQMVGMKSHLFLNVAAVGLGLLVVLFGRRYGAGWRSHVQQIAIGLSTAALAELSLQAIRDALVRTANAASAANTPIDRDRLSELWNRASYANSAVYIAVAIWWIACLWIDEPTATSSAEPTAPSETADTEPQTDAAE